MSPSITAYVLQCPILYKGLRRACASGGVLLFDLVFMVVAAYGIELACIKLS